MPERIMKNRRRFKRVLAWTPLGVLLAVGLVGAAWRGRTTVTPPPTDGEPNRWVHLEGAANTRDVGGYVTRDGRTVRRGMVYRSGTLARLSSAGVASFRKLG